MKILKFLRACYTKLQINLLMYHFWGKFTMPFPFDLDQLLTAARFPQIMNKTEYNAEDSGFQYFTSTDSQSSAKQFSRKGY